MSRKPRSEIFFPSVQTPNDNNYVPKPTRDEELARWFEGKPRGIVVARLQKVGSAAAERTFDRVIATGDAEATWNAADILSLTSFGTAYHTFAENAAREVMYRRVQLPRLFDPETQEYMTKEQLFGKIQSGLSNAAGLATTIENLHIDRQTKAKSKHEIAFGRALAATGANLAVAAANATVLRGDEDEIQWHVWQAAQKSYTRMLELTGEIGARPTVAQLADEHSPLRRYMNDSPETVLQPVHAILLEEVEEARAA